VVSIKISIIGTGYVGLVSAGCFAKLGHKIICVDIDSNILDKINRGISPIYEKDLDEILSKNLDRIQATGNYEKAICSSDITFICVGTPSKKNGEIDLSYLKKSSEQIGKILKDKESWHLVVVKSTVLPGTTRDVVLPILEKASGKKAGIDFGIAMNPEFLREGVAVSDFLNPDRIVIGSSDKKSKKTLKKLYNGFKCQIFETSLSAAEMIKYASNCFLATKISYINEIGNMCKKLEIDTYEVADGMGLDSRIKRDFLNSGIGWGGSCFPKDVKALEFWAKKQNLDTEIIDSVIRVNNKQPLKVLELLKKHIKDINGKTIGILGLAFKSDTDDIRESRTIPIVRSLIEKGAYVKVYDPKAMDNFKKIFPDLIYCSSAEEVLDSDVVIIATVWDSFKNLDYSNSIVIDGRKLKQAKKAKVYEGVCW